LKEWLSARKDIFVREMDEKTQKILKEVFELPEIQSLIDNNKKRNKADPFVLAYGKAYDATIVTNDIGLIKICDKEGLKNIRDHEFVSENNIKFSVK
jgi:hypothetical protein